MTHYRKILKILEMAEDSPE